MSRHPVLYIFALIAIVCGHVYFCYPAATLRGRPTAFWGIVAPYLMFCAVFIAPLFDDFDDAPSIRVSILTMFTFAMSVVFAVVNINLESAVPRPGAHLGFTGLLWHYWDVVIVKSIACLIIAVPFTFCLESIGRGFWLVFRRFRPDGI